MFHKHSVKGIYEKSYNKMDIATCNNVFVQRDLVMWHQ